MHTVSPLVFQGTLPANSLQRTQRGGGTQAAPRLPLCVQRGLAHPGPGGLSHQACSHGSDVGRDVGSVCQSLLMGNEQRGLHGAWTEVTVAEDGCEEGFCSAAAARLARVPFPGHAGSPQHQSPQVCTQSPSGGALGVTLLPSSPPRRCPVLCHQQAAWPRSLGFLAVEGSCAEPGRRGGVGGGHSQQGPPGPAPVVPRPGGGGPCRIWKAPHS